MTGLTMWKRTKSILLLTLKLLALAFPLGMALVQIPELRYDFGPKTPLIIQTPEQLAAADLEKARLVNLTGRGDFEHAFVMNRYGISYTYFLLKPYGQSLVVRTYEKVDDDWQGFENFVGKLRPFRRQPFAYRVRDSFAKQFGVEIPPEAHFLALYDMPRPDGWQIAALIFSAVLFAVMLYFFFLRKRRTPAKGAGQTGCQSCCAGADIA